MEKLISIIIPAYNAEQSLGKCLSSVVGQTFKALEIILINDGSTDSTPALCDAWAEKDNRIRVVHQANKGLAENRNIGVALAQAPYIGFVDSDDWIAEDMFETLYQQAVKYNAEIAVCGVVMLFPNGEKKLQNTSKTEKIIKKETALKQLLMDRKMKSYCCNKLFRTSLFEGIVFPSGRYFEDYSIMYQLFAKTEKVTHSGKNSYFYVQHSSSILHSANPKKEVDYFNSNTEIIDFVTNSELFSQKWKKILQLKIQKRLVRTYAKLLGSTQPDAFANEKKAMLSYIENFLKKPFNPEKRKQILAELSLKRVWSTFFG